jgi:hypothetical protein
MKFRLLRAPEQDKGGASFKVDQRIWPMSDLQVEVQSIHQCYWLSVVVC